MLFEGLLSMALFVIRRALMASIGTTKINIYAPPLPQYCGLNPKRFVK